MSETYDVNVFVYATDPGSPVHERAREVVRSIAISAAPVYLFWPVLLGFMRLVTSEHLMRTPLDFVTATANVDALLALPNVRVVGEREGFWRSYRAVAEPLRARGNLVSDAHIVALMHQHGVGTIWTRDRDFRKFDDIKVRDPFDLG